MKSISSLVSKLLNLVHNFASRSLRSLNFHFLMMLAKAPVEIPDQIISYLDRQDLLALCQVSSNTRARFLSALYQIITL